MVGPLKRMVEVERPRVVGSVTLGHGANEFFSIVIPPIIPLLVTDLGISYAQAGFLLTMFFIMYSIFQLPAGIVADWVGKKRLLVAGLVTMSIGILLASAATSYEHLLVAQAIAGIGGSTFHPTGMSIISDAETKATEGKAMGIFGSGGAFGTLAAPVVVGGLAAVTGWRVALAGAGILGIIVTIAFVVLYSDGSEDEPAAANGGTPGGESTNGGTPAGDSPTDAESTPGVLERLRAMSLGAAIRAAPEKVSLGSRAAVGQIVRSLTVPVILLFLATMLLSLQHRAIQTYTTSYIVAETGASLSIGNLAFFTLLLGGTLSSLWAGELADRVNRKLLGGVTAVATAILVGTTILVAPVLGWLPEGPLFLVLSVWFFAIGVMMYASYPVKNALVSQQAEAEFSGSLFGIIQTASAIGSATGPALFGVLSTQWGVVAAFPAIAVVSVMLAAIFAVLALVKE